MGKEGFAEQFSFELNPITKVIAGNRDGLKANLERRNIMIIVNLEKDVN